jgi:small redox-active disulfide protein 2
MEIKILGTGCPKCNTLEKNVQEALKEMGKEATVEKVTEIQKIMEYGVMLTPALVVEGVVKASGRVPNKAEIKEIIGS